MKFKNPFAKSNNQQLDDEQKEMISTSPIPDKNAGVDLGINPIQDTHNYQPGLGLRSQMSSYSGYIQTPHIPTSSPGSNSTNSLKYNTTNNSVPWWTTSINLSAPLLSGLSTMNFSLPGEHLSEDAVKTVSGRISVAKGRDILEALKENDEKSNRIKESISMLQKQLEIRKKLDLVLRGKNKETCKRRKLK